MPVYMSQVGMGGVVSNPLTVGLVANWRCNEASGNLLDSTANANDLTAVNSLVQRRARSTVAARSTAQASMQRTHLMPSWSVPGKAGL